jgi:hypothetical protein
MAEVRFPAGKRDLSLLRNEEIHKSFFSPNIMIITLSRKRREYFTHMLDEKYVENSNWRKIGLKKVK